jgi:hypothetical protein
MVVSVPRWLRGCRRPAGRQTGDAEKTGIDRTNVIRTTWVKGGRRVVLVHRAWSPSWTR